VLVVDALNTFCKTLEIDADDGLALGVETGLLNKGLVEIKYSLLGCDDVYVVRCTYMWPSPFIPKTKAAHSAKLFFLTICKITRHHMSEQVIVMFTVVVTLNLTIARGKCTRIAGDYD
jgi:hypothetical protein